MPSNGYEFENILPITLTVEGGKTRDHRGDTNRGISQETYDAFRKQKKLPIKSVLDLTYGETKEFYQDEFYKRPKIDKLSGKLRMNVFDYAVHSSPKQAIMDLQKIVGTKADGIIGDKTLAKVEKFVTKYGDKALSLKLLKARADYLTNLVITNPQKYGQFEEGWGNRIKFLSDLTESD